MLICGEWKFLLGDPLKDPKEANHSKILWQGEIMNESGYNKHLMGSGTNSTIISIPIVLNSTMGIPRIEVFLLRVRHMEKDFQCLGFVP